MIFRALPGGTIEVFIDHRQDQYSKGGWSWLQCSGLRRVEAPAGLELQPGLNDEDCSVIPFQ
jgi:hypothetical protein